MCGICGVVALDQGIINSPEVIAASKRISHRGPDDEGYLLHSLNDDSFYCVGGKDTPKSVFESNLLYSPKKVINSCIDENRYDVVLIHHRLSIVDLTAAGHQPMCNEDGTVWIVYNGEIYNFRELKGELLNLGHHFVSNTDTEVIIHAYEEWGKECLKKFNGMWAFCIWDSRKKKIFCSRDRFGIKPFFYYLDKDKEKFIFASEINALLAYSGVEREVENQAVYDFLVSGLCNHGEYTFFAGIKQLVPGKFLEINLKTKQINISTYWKLDLSIKTALSEEENIHHFRRLFEDSIRLRLVSDVQVGTCLSGGLDSSSIVCLISKFMENKVSEAVSLGKYQKTFSSRYADLRHDEGEYIDVVTKMTGADAHYIYPTPEKLLDDLDDLIECQGEPFGSTSIFAQWCVFKLAQESGVKVTLDGQGADELLAGYLNYFSVYWAELLLSFHLLDLTKEIMNYNKHHNTLLKDNILQACHHLMYAKIIGKIFPPIRNFLRRFVVREEFHGVKEEFIHYMSQESFYKRYPFNMVNLKGLLYHTFFYSSLPALLRYEDRNSMFYSIESRVPFLDHRLVEFIFNLPEDFKIRNGMTKWVLRESMKNILPEKIRMRQDKIGFSTPEDEWFRGPMKAFIKDVISSDKFKSRPFFDNGKIQSLFKRHCNGEINISVFVWRWVNLELWLSKFIDG